MPAPSRSLLTVVLSKKMLICVFVGFSSGLPLWLLLNLLPAWLRSEGVDLASIGLMALVQFPYTWKFLWSPLLDRFSLPLGRRRGWMAFAQLGLIGTIGVLGTLRPLSEMVLVAVVATLVAVLSATQDIAIDAYRRELLTDEELGLGNVVHVNAYKVAGLVPGSLSLVLADRLPWVDVFWITGLFLIPGLVVSVLVKEPDVKVRPATLKAAVIEPFREFVTRFGWSGGLLTLSFVFLFPVGAALTTALATPFFLDLAYSKSQIGLVAKHAMLWPAVLGGFLGGVWMVRLGINRALWVFGTVQLLSLGGFAWLAMYGRQEHIDGAALARLAVVLSLEALGVGLATSAFVAFIARATCPGYTATQLALFTSLAAVPRTFVSASAGYLVEWVGYTRFFVLCMVFALPGLALLLKVAPWSGDRAKHPAPT